ncbi:MAG: monovalent cation/H+ antiporter complex subunit F [Sandaracinaceae bacterium]
MTLAIIIAGGAIVAAALALVRLVKGPGQANRIVALDVVFAATIATTGAATLASGRALYLDVGIGLALVGFVATMVWARLIDASALDPGGEGGEPEGKP